MNLMGDKKYTSPNNSHAVQKFFLIELLNIGMKNFFNPNSFSLRFKRTSHVSNVVTKFHVASLPEISFCHNVGGYAIRAVKQKHLSV